MTPKGTNMVAAVYLRQFTIRVRIMNKVRVRVGASFLPSHTIPSHPIPSYPIPSHPIPSHPVSPPIRPINLLYPLPDILRLLHT